MSALLRARTLALTLALAPGLGACAGRAATLPSPEGQPTTVVEVVNRATLDMNVYVVPESGGRERLGTATSHVTTHFTIPRRHLFGVTNLRFQADPVGSVRTHLSEQVLVIPGDTVVLTIPPT